MRALMITSYGKMNDSLKIMDIPKPKIKDNQLLIQAHAASVNPVDYKIVLGNLKAALRFKLPAPIGFDVSGTVAEVGKNVKKFKLGDEVFSRVSIPNIGTFAEFVAIDEQLLAQKPQNLIHTEAASIPLVGETTYQALYKVLALQSGQKILIHAGAGGIGSFAIQMAKSLGAYVATTTSTRNIDFVKQLGADFVVDYTKQNYLELLNNYDAVYDTLGGQYTYDAFKIIKPRGTVVSIAGPKDVKSVKQVTNNFIIKAVFWFKSRKIFATAKNSDANYRYLLQQPNGEHLAEIKSLIEDGKIKPVIDTIYPFDKSIEAFEHVQKGRSRGKVVVEIHKS